MIGEKKKGCINPGSKQRRKEERSPGWEDYCKGENSRPFDVENASGSEMEKGDVQKRGGGGKGLKKKRRFEGDSGNSV